MSLIPLGSFLKTLQKHYSQHYFPIAIVCGCVFEL